MRGWRWGFGLRRDRLAAGHLLTARDFVETNYWVSSSNQGRWYGRRVFSMRQRAQCWCWCWYRRSQMPNFGLLCRRLNRGSLVKCLIVTVAAKRIHRLVILPLRGRRSRSATEVTTDVFSSCHFRRRGARWLLLVVVARFGFRFFCDFR